MIIFGRNGDDCHLKGVGSLRAVRLRVTLVASSGVSGVIAVGAPEEAKADEVTCARPSPIETGGHCHLLAIPINSSLR